MEVPRGRLDVDGHETVGGLVVVEHLHHLFGAVPEVLLARQVGEVLELELKSGGFGGGGGAGVGVRGQALELAEVDARVGDSRGRVEGGHEAVGEVAGLFKVEVLAWRAHVVVGDRGEVGVLGAEVVG